MNRTNRTKALVELADPYREKLSLVKKIDVRKYSDRK